MAPLTIRLNGDERVVEIGSTVAALVAQLELPNARVAVERNGDVVPRARWQETVLADGDRLEVVTFVGGG